jgi:two-component system, NtrC family, sensor kinase
MDRRSTLPTSRRYPPTTKAIGAILIRRFEVRAFTDKQISLLETFAHQAVIAIENVRLFNETKQALERQTATSEILRVISSSPMDVQPVLDAVAESATRLCGATDALVYRVETGMILRVAHFGPVPSVSDARPVTRETVTGRSILERRAIHVHDLLNEMDQGEYAETQSLQGGIRTVLSVPLTREDLVLGAITIRRTQVDPFTEPQIELLKTFADQAVIAIENVRLFTELQASNRELTTALDTQTATSDILRVISRSQTDVQPVFDAIVESAARLLGVHLISMTRVVGDQVDLAALTGPDVRGVAVVRAAFPMTLESPGVHTRAIRDRVAINCADVHADPLTTEHGHAIARALGYESLTVVPMIRDDVAVGSISAARQERGGFTHDEIALLQTFADQAVIAIENVRLLTELQARTHELTRSVDQLTALGDVGRAVSSSLDLDTVLTTIVGRAVQLSGTDGGTIFEYDESAEEFTARATLNADAAQSAMLRTTRLRRGEGAVGQMAVTQEPFQIPDIAAEGAYESRIRGAMLESGTRSVLAIPLLHEQRLVGGLVVTRRVSGEFSAEVVDLLRTFATQSALAIQNARLFREIEIKSRELEVASQHKSEFLASMSHELRTPLNAIIGFSDVLLQGMFGEMSEKQTEYLQDILASGQHLLSLINDILDLSKIEAGRMDLDVAAFDLPSAIDDALLLMRERASRRSLTLERQVDERLGEIRADQRKVKQVLLNLVSNAVKFTPEGGRIEVRAALVDGAVEISVTDTGIGIAPEDHEAVFEEFRQVGKAEKKAEGTGLGLALCRKFVELHGGKIWVKSELGQGSTFAFTIPVRHG